MELTIYDVSHEGKYAGHSGSLNIIDGHTVTGREITYQIVNPSTGETINRIYRPGISAKLAMNTIESGRIGMAAGVVMDTVLIERLKPVSDRPIDSQKVEAMFQALRPLVTELNQIKDDKEHQEKLNSAYFKLGTIAVSVEGYIIDGLHRFEAFKKIDLPAIACVVVNVLKEEEKDDFDRLLSAVDAHREKLKKEAEAEAKRIKDLEEEAQKSKEEARKLQLELDGQRSPKLFRDKNTAPFASSSAVSGAMDVLAKGSLVYNNFKQDDIGYYLERANKTRIYLLPGYDTEDVYDVITCGEVARTALESFSLEAAIVNHLYAAKAADLPDPTQSFIYHYDELCENLGLDKKNISSKKKLENLHKWCLQPGSLSCAVLDVSQKLIAVHKIWEISPRYHQNGKISFEVRPGMWAKHYLEPDKSKRDEKGTTSTRQISHFSKSDVTRSFKNCQKRPGAVRLMLWLPIKHRQDGAKYNPITVKTCMIQAYGESEVNHALSDKQKTQKFWLKWENDLLFLHESGWKIDAIDWPDESKPDWMLEKEFLPVGFTRNKGYFERTLQLKIVIYPPSEVRVELDKLKVNEKPIIQIKPKEIDPDLPAKLKATRTNRDLSQQQAADVLKIGTDTYKKIEQGKRKPSAKILSDIKAWIET